MVAVGVVLVVLAIAWILAYQGVSLAVWTAATALVVTGLAMAGVLGLWGTVVAAIVLVPPAVVLNLPGLRRPFLTERVFQMFRKVLPPMTGTEREALEAGLVGRGAVRRQTGASCGTCR